MLGVESLPISFCAESTCNQQQIWGHFIKYYFLSEFSLKYFRRICASTNKDRSLRGCNGFKNFLKAGFKPEQEMDFLLAFFFLKNPILIFHLSTEMLSSLHLILFQF